MTNPCPPSLAAQSYAPSFMKRRRARSGFTLIEVLVVLVVLAVVIGFTLTQMRSPVASARKAENVASLSNAFKSAQALFADAPESYGSSGALVTHLTAGDIPSQSLVNELADPAGVGNVGVLVYDAGRSVLLKRRGKDGELRWMRSNYGINQLSTGTGTILFSETFERPDEVITNEFATYNSSNPGIHTSPNWRMASGSSFVRDNTGWTGDSDNTVPDIDSAITNHSALFRFTGKRIDFGDVAFDVDVRVNAIPSWPINGSSRQFDTAYIYMRRLASGAGYFLVFNRRNGAVNFEKESTSGIYSLMTPVIAGERPVPIGQWQHLRAEIQTNTDGSVTIRLFANGKLIKSATDIGANGAPVTATGGIGLGSNNFDMNFDNLVVSSL